MKKLIFLLFLLTMAAITFGCSTAHYCPSYSGFQYNYKTVMAKSYKKEDARARAKQSRKIQVR